MLEEFIIEQEVLKKEKRRQPKVHDIVALNEQLRRLNVIYLAGNIGDEEYSAETRRLKSQLEAAKKQEAANAPMNIDRIKDFLKSDFLDVYHSLSKENQRRMWRSVIEEIYIEGTAVTGIRPRA